MNFKSSVVDTRLSLVEEAGQDKSGGKAAFNVTSRSKLSFHKPSQESKLREMALVEG